MQVALCLTDTILIYLHWENTRRYICSWTCRGTKSGRALLRVALHCQLHPAPIPSGGREEHCWGPLALYLPEPVQKLVPRSTDLEMLIPKITHTFSNTFANIFFLYHLKKINNSQNKT